MHDFLIAYVASVGNLTIRGNTYIKFANIRPTKEEVEALVIAVSRDLTKNTIHLVFKDQLSITNIMPLW